jgi:YVTN family beta-propeller protein
VFFYFDLLTPKFIKYICQITSLLYNKNTNIKRTRLRTRKMFQLKLPLGVAITPNGAKIYIANFMDETISVIATNNHKVIGTIRVEGAPFEIAITPDGTRAYVMATFQGYDIVYVIDIDNHAVIATINITIGRNFSMGLENGIAITPNGKKVYAIAGKTVSVIDTDNHTVIATIDEEPFRFLTGVAITPDGMKVYVIRGSAVLVIATDNDTVIDTLLLGMEKVCFLTRVAITPDGSRAYVANWESHDVSVIDTVTDQILATIPMMGKLGKSIAIGRLTW